MLFVLKTSFSRRGRRRRLNDIFEYWNNNFVCIVLDDVWIFDRWCWFFWMFVCCVLVLRSLFWWYWLYFLLLCSFVVANRSVGVCELIGFCCKCGIYIFLKFYLWCIWCELWFLCLSFVVCILEIYNIFVWDVWLGFVVWLVVREVWIRIAVLGIKFLCKYVNYSFFVY